MANMGIYCFSFTTVTQDQIGKCFCYTSKEEGQIGHLHPSNLINMKHMQILVGLFDKAHKNPLAESISFKQQF